MTGMRTLRAAIGTVVLFTCASIASAQQSDQGRASAEGVAAVSMFSSWSEPAIILDGTAAVRLNNRSVALVRPWVWKRQDGSWTSEWYQLQVRYESGTRIPVRVDAGIMPSPLGLATLEFRPDLNPTVSPPFYYFIPLPRFDTTFDGVQMMSSGYPLGALVSTSGQHWDARGGITTATPAFAREELKSGQPSSMPQIVLGGGITPIAGVRIGGGFAHGRYRDARPAPAPAGAGYAPGTVDTVISSMIPAAHATVTNIEAEYAFGHTRLKGEWVWDRFETTTQPAKATAFYAQAVHTFTPRWFGSTRVTSANAPTTTGTHVRASVVEAIAGYRLTRSLTLRGGYYTDRYYRAPKWDRELCISAVWSGRWR
jgi:hypothetical protein